METDTLGPAGGQDLLQNEKSVIHSKMQNPAILVLYAMQALKALSNTSRKGGVSIRTLGSIELRASQINGGSVCVDLQARELRRSVESDECLFAVAAWRNMPCFTNAERAALGLAESVTRISDQLDPVPDSIWNEACKYSDEISLSSLLISIASINVWNRFNVSTRQVAGQWKR